MQSDPPAQSERPTLNPSSLSVDDAARLLSSAGGQRITVEMIQSDVDAGAPINGDGTVNLLHYTAWLVREMSSRGD